MNYIVWRESFTTYSVHQGGYYVKYKDKLSDEYSDNWYDANKYKSIGAAIKRLGIRIGNCTNLGDFVRMNTEKSKLANRDLKLSSILDEEIDISVVISHRGRIEKVDKGELLGSAEEEIVNFIKKKIKSNHKRNQKALSDAGIDVEIPYISAKKENADFWDDWGKS